MYRPNFCVECGERLAQNGWRAWISAKFCEKCAGRLGRSAFARPLVIIAVIAISAFVLGRYLRPVPPPLIIQRAANSPLSDLPVNLNNPSRANSRIADSTDQNVGLVNAQATDDVVYICGARTKKGTPCRRRVHFAGERCYQHKGRPAMVALERLVVK